MDRGSLRGHVLNSSRLVSARQEILICRTTCTRSFSRETLLLFDSLRECVINIDCSYILCICYITSPASHAQRDPLREHLVLRAGYGGVKLCSAHQEKLISQCFRSTTSHTEMEGDKESSQTSTESRSRSSSPNLTADISLSVPSKPAGKTRASSPSTIPAPLVIKARSQVSRFEALQALRDDIPTDAGSASLAEVESLLDSVTEFHKAFLSEHAHMEEFWPVKGLSHEYFASDLMGREAKLVARLNKTLKVLIAQCKSQSSSSTSDSTAEAMAVRAAKLPDLAIPKFDGKFVEWPAFSELFTSLIVNDSRLGDIDRLCYLRASLTGEPSRRVNAYPMRGSSFPAAWEYLGKRFSNKRLLIKEQLDKLLSIAPIATRSAHALNDLAATINEVTETLIALGADKDMHNCLLVHIITISLDKVTREAWETSLANSAECPRYQDLLAFVETKGGALEQMEAPVKKPAAPSTSSARSSQRRYTSHPATQEKKHSQQSSQKQASQYPCDWCRGDHFMVMCPKFREAPVTDRRNFIVAKELCKNCCGRHHTDVCKSTHRCKTCGAKHHSMLHPTKPAATQGSAQAQPRSTTEPSSAQPAPPTEGKKSENNADF